MVIFLGFFGILIPFIVSASTIKATPQICISLLAYPIVFRLTREFEFENEINDFVYQITTVITWIVVALVTFVLGIFFIPIMLILPQSRFKLMFIGSAVIIYCFGVRVKHVGLLPKKDGPYIICPNHTSFLDYFLSTYIMGWKGKYTVVHGSNLHGIPFIGSVMKKWLISVDRSDSRTFFPMIKQMRRALEDGYNVLIYPEGGRKTEAQTKSGIILNRFKPGAFNVACDLGLPIVPITIIGADTFKPKDSSRWWLQHCWVKIVFHEPISSENVFPERLSEMTRQAIMSAL